VYETNGCSSTACFTATWAPIIQAGYPLVLGEFGDYTPSGGSPNQSFAQMILDWLDQNGAAGETAWTWNNWAGTNMALIASPDGSSLTPWGAYISGQYAQRFP
jgi:aryl-phospho-beta-D-glucosidase BglC (GH1 family)